MKILSITILMGLLAVALVGCTKAAASTTAEDKRCSCVKLSEVKKFKSQYCPNEYPLFQGYYSDRDGVNAWCRKLDSGTCPCPPMGSNVGQIVFERPAVVLPFEEEQR